MRVLNTCVTMVIWLSFVGLSSACGEAAADTNRSLVILSLGDSITLGASHPEWVPGGYRDPLLASLGRAGYSVRFVGSQTNNGSPLLNSTGNTAHEGHGGFTTAQLLRTLDGMSVSNANTVLLLAGVNDLGVRQLAPEQGLAGLELLINRIASLLPNGYIIVATLPPYIGGKYPLREEHQRQFNAALPDLIERQRVAGRRLSLCDLRAYLDADSAAAYLCSDGVHPNQEGYIKIASAWFQAIQTMSESKVAGRTASHKPRS